MKKTFVGLTLAAVLAVAPYAANAETEVVAEPVAVEQSVSVNINGQLIDFPDVKPFINEELDKTYVPIRFIGEALNAQVDWVEDHAELVKGDTLIKIWIDNPEILVNGEAVTIDAPAILVDNIRTMVPLQFISEILGEEVVLDEVTSAVTIGEPVVEEPVAEEPAAEEPAAEETVEEAATEEPAAEEPAADEDAIEEPVAEEVK